ncbi:MAG: folB [Bacteriovoracaceae bacterium]|nr:folB [Bacteriovoracaceae bacterium]
MSLRKSVLYIDSYECKVKLGCLADERAHPQDVRFSCRLDFREEPLANLTDELKDAICYDKLTQLIASACSQREFKTVEHLAHICFEKIRSDLPASIKLFLEVHKVKPPIQNLLGGVRFTLEDS